MLSIKSVPAVALFGALLLGWSSSAVAENAQNEVRQTYRSDCQAQSGKGKGACMREASHQVWELMQLAVSEYRKCINEGYERSFCEEVRDDVWRNSQVY